MDFISGEFLPLFSLVLFPVFAATWDPDAQLHLRVSKYHSHPSTMTITHAWALRVIYGSLFLSVAVILVIFPPQVWPSRLWKPSCDAVEPPSSAPSPSPSPSPAATAPKAPVWLIATISAAKAFERRNLIRATWQSLYNNPVFETRFVIAEPGEALMHVIEFENKTHGDLIMIRVRMMHSIFCMLRDLGLL